MARISSTLKAQIKSAARRATTARLRGRGHLGQQLQAKVDALVKRAERTGHGDDAFEAEIAGTQLAESQSSRRTYGRDKASARKRTLRSAKRRKTSPYTRFRKTHKGSGLSMKAVARLWRTHRTTSTRTRKGKKMATRTLPKELLDLARALKEASAKEPSAAKASAIERKMESLIRQLRNAQKSAGSKARREMENEEIRAQAKEWAQKGPSGDPGRRKKSGGYSKFVKAFAKKHRGKGVGSLSKAASRKWRSLSAASKAKWGAVKKRKKTSARRDPGYRRASTARRYRSRRHTSRRRRPR
jgi:hypothetical protein